MILVITLSDKKFDEKYRNFCYKNLTSLTKQFRDDLEDYLDDMDDFIKRIKDSIKLATYEGKLYIKRDEPEQSEYFD